MNELQLSFNNTLLSDSIQVVKDTDQGEVNIKQSPEITTSIVDPLMVSRTLLGSIPNSNLIPLSANTFMLNHECGTKCYIIVNSDSSITEEDVASMEIDALSVIRNGDANSVIYYSPNAFHIPFRGDYHVGSMDGYPCVMVASSDERSLYYATKTVMGMWKYSCDLSYVSQGNSSPENNTDQLLNETLRFFKHITCGNMNRKHYINGLLEQLQADERSCNILMKKISEMRLNFNVIDPLKEVDSTYDEVMEKYVAKIIQYRQSTKLWPKSKDIDITVSETRKLGGYKTLLNVAKQRCCSKK